MTKRPNVLFLMTDQHNSLSMGCAGHTTVRTPALDGLAAQGVRFTSAYCNNPICAPSRISFATAQYPHTHGFLGNNNFEFEERNSDTLAAVFRRHGYQTALIGKAHMIRAWDNEGYEHLRYCDLCDSDRADPTTNHYFQYLIENGVADAYEDGTLPRDSEAVRKKCAVAQLPYEHTNEHWTGEETLSFLENRDQARPFLVHMTFERPHPHWTPAAEHADMYDPETIELGPDAVDWWENRWAGRPEFIMRAAANRMRGFSLADLKKAIAYHFALVTVIDMEIGRVLDWLKEHGELDNTIVVYTADHGDFAGDHGICDKNMGIYESIHRIPFLLTYPGSPQGVTRDGIIESVDLFPTLCDLASVPCPAGVDGRSVVPEAEGRGDGKPQAICEWDFPAPQRRVNAIRTPRHRLVYYSHEQGGELYDHETDPYEMENLWDSPAHRGARLALLEQLLDQVNLYRRKSDFDTDAVQAQRERYLPSRLLHKRCVKWSDIRDTFG
ncbi:MAG: sulfatase-like hydrolase/transferase [Lentisphaerae bacterium]|jgi:arylsulfatase A-like enzyme|nr:sulfatase-like hydrolase/transferase [Lentisphaerota bacterium]MBT4820693.1 sulfatase-like hydrolase/transferase [Lentisphaerota bacterium]MBT5610810.1 sulfatase-like hydrolase/transferase [Lentisphaerota bacterium]MBT7053758.1 sulfatase-like hydrolase/transferase [Lentisphaerota bacterium]MBT7841219.1 sulfatase-like hydrolase/transferase [Lentisphaerota bacterium]